MWRGGDPYGIFWQVVQVIGNSTQGEDYRTLWRDESLNQPSTKDCKLITNGDNFLEVHLDNKLVYSNSSLDLQMPPPFNSYLELTTPSADEMRYGQFKDYYETYGKGIKLINLPANGSVQIIGNSNQLISNSSINSKGVVEFDLLQHPFPLVANMRIYDSEGKIYASTSKEQHYFWWRHIFTRRTLIPRDIYSLVNVASSLPIQFLIKNQPSLVLIGGAYLSIVFGNI